MIRDIWGQGKRPKLVGPDMNNERAENWTKSFVETMQSAGVTLDAFTIHSYDGGKPEHEAGVLAREMPTLEYLDKLITNGKRYTGWLASLAPETELWIGECARSSLSSPL